MAKQIYASLQIADNEIRILVSEFFNGRLHILKVERVAHSGIINYKIVDQEAIVTAIEKGLENIHVNLRVKVKKVLLVMPSLGLQRVNRTLHSDINDSLSRIQIEDVYRIYRNALNQRPQSDHEMINAEIYQFKLNGNYVFKMPLNEKASRLSGDIDLYYVNRDIVYQYALIVEKANLEILDVCVDSIAVSKEAFTFDPYDEVYQIGVQIERQHTTLSLYYKGRLIHAEILETGTQAWIETLANHLDIPLEVATRLLFDNVDLQLQQYSKEPLYLWSKDKKSYTCSQDDIMQAVKNEIQSTLETISLSSQNIYEDHPTRFEILSEGAMIKGIAHRLHEISGVETSQYVPTTIGARDACLSAVLGSFYSYIDHIQWHDQAQVSIDSNEFILSLSQYVKDNQDSKITTRIRTMFDKPAQRRSSE